MDKIKCPPWLNEQPEIVALLDYFVTKLDTKPVEAWPYPPGVTFSEKRYPWLFCLNEQSDLQWEYLLSLVNDYGIFELIYDEKRNPFDPEFSNARLRLNLGRVDLLRQWLNRPLMPSAQEQWRVLVEKYFPKNADLLAKRLLIYEGKSPEEIINAFVQIEPFVNEGLTLRQLSAKCFWGDSKYLEHREELLLSVYPELKIAPRPIIISVFLPEKIKAVLFIENQDSYLNSVGEQSKSLSDLALVYCAGFRGTADRIREPQGISFHYRGVVSSSNQAKLESWWFETSTISLPVYFWGDLDYEGMRILKILKQRFKQIDAWQPGYKIMLEHLKNGNAHPLQTNDKGNQTDPEHTDCAYADSLLLPAIRQFHRFVDQEVVSW